MKTALKYFTDRVGSKFKTENPVVQIQKLNFFKVTHGYAFNKAQNFLSSSVLVFANMSLFNEGGKITFTKP